MFIGIDGNEANVKQRVGIGQYAFQVLKHLKKIQNSIRPLADKVQNHNIKFKIYLKDNPLDDLPDETNVWKYEVFGPQKLWTQFALPARLLLDQDRPDVFYSPSHYAPRFSLIPTAISIMDLSYIHFPEMFTKMDLYQLNRWTSYSIKQAKKIFTISEFSKHEIVTHYKIPKDKVIVTYPGYDEKKFKVQSSKFNVNSVKQKFKISDNYILFVGTLQPRKNIERLIKAFNKVRHKYTNLQLVIVGKKGWLYDGIFQKVKELGLENDVVFCDFVTDEELSVFYKEARCFVLPSLYEGFGIPVVEAMACGCPVVVSNTTSLPEIIGDAGLLTDPQDIEQLSEKIEIAAYNGRIRSNLIGKGLNQVNKYSWETCAEVTLAELIKSGRN